MIYFLSSQAVQTRRWRLVGSSRDESRSRTAEAGTWMVVQAALQK